MAKQTTYEQRETRRQLEVKADQLFGRIKELRAENDRAYGRMLREQEDRSAIIVALEIELRQIVHQLNPGE